MKRYKCECEYALFPFGDGMPICIREWEMQNTEKSVSAALKLSKNCIEKGCEHYKRRSRINEEREEQKKKCWNKD